MRPRLTLPVAVLALLLGGAVAAAARARRGPRGDASQLSPVVHGVRVEGASLLNDGDVLLQVSEFGLTPDGLLYSPPYVHEIQRVVDEARARVETVPLGQHRRIGSIEL